MDKGKSYSSLWVSTPSPPWNGMKIFDLNNSHGALAKVLMVHYSLQIIKSNNFYFDDNAQLGLN